MMSCTSSGEDRPAARSSSPIWISFGRASGLFVRDSAASSLLPSLLLLQTGTDRWQFHPSQMAGIQGVLRLIWESPAAKRGLDVNPKQRRCIVTTERLIRRHDFWCHLMSAPISTETLVTGSISETLSASGPDNHDTSIATLIFEDSGEISVDAEKR